MRLPKRLLPGVCFGTDWSDSADSKIAMRVCSYNPPPIGIELLEAAGVNV
jgi:hypothetical protein